MALVWLTPEVEPEPNPNEPWNIAPGDTYWRANFYTAAHPYLRKPVYITDLSLREDAERAMRDEGYVPMAELPAEVIRYWAENDAAWLASDILRHLADR